VKSIVIYQTNTHTNTQKKMNKKNEQKNILCIVTASMWNWFIKPIFWNVANTASVSASSVYFHVSKVTSVNEFHSMDDERWWWWLEERGSWVGTIISLMEIGASDGDGCCCDWWESARSRILTPWSRTPSLLIYFQKRRNS